MTIISFQKVKQDEPLSHKVEQQIRNAIFKKVFNPGDRLPSEVVLSETFGVSRTAIREALRMLAGRGLITIRKGSGIYVSEIDIASVVDPFYQLLEMKCGRASMLQLIDIRSIIEPEIAGLAAENRSDYDLNYLDKKLNAMRLHLHQPEKMIDFDLNFHKRVALATNNAIIPIMMEPIFQLTYKFITTTYKQSHAPDLAIQRHTELLECLINKDKRGAKNTMKQHMKEGKRHILLYYRKIGLTFDK